MYGFLYHCFFEMLLLMSVGGPGWPDYYPPLSQNKVMSNEATMTSSSLFYDTESRPLWNPCYSTSPSFIPPYQSTCYAPPPQPIMYKNRVGVTPPLKDIESRVDPAVPPLRQKSHSSDDNKCNGEGHAVRYPIPMRRAPMDWDSARPSQEKRNAKQWWKLCS